MPGATLAENLDTLGRIAVLFEECAQSIKDLVGRVKTSAGPGTPNVILMDDMRLVSAAWRNAGDALGRVPVHVDASESPGPALLDAETELTKIRDLLRRQVP